MKMKVDQGGFDGFNSYEPGVADVAIDHARKVFVLGHGGPVDDKDKPLAFDAACDLFRLQPEERVTAKTNHGTEK